MIKSIKKLKQFGIFKNHTNDSAKTKDFEKFNLFYGYNGSGKSTLSDVFRCIEKKTTSSKFPSSEFTVSIDNGKEITQANVAKSKLNVYTFNHDFIDENIAWDSVVKSTLLVDKEKIQEHGNLKKLKETLNANTEKHKKDAKEIENLEKSVAKFLVDGARNIKNSLQSIDTTDSHYLNYNKGKFAKLINENLKESKSGALLLDRQKVVGLINAAKLVYGKPIIAFNKQAFKQQAFNQETFTKAKERLNGLLKTSAISQRNDDCKAFKIQLKQADDWLASLYIKPLNLPDKSDFYNEFKDQYDKACVTLEKAIADLNKEITVWHTTLKEKTANPLKKNLTVVAISEQSAKAFNDAITGIRSSVGKHNSKPSNLKEATEEIKKKIELHYAAKEIKAFGYHNKKKKIINKINGNAKLHKKNEERKKEIKTLENSLSYERFGADRFNKMLHRFLNRSDLILCFNQVEKGYEIRRNNQLARNLSEGEKTAIAFVYFITKLNENDNNIQDTIVVVDDPISNFDSNCLFHAYSFMKMHCKEAKQLFVLTHDFAFFKWVRDWISQEKKSANIYVVEENNDKKPRNATYADAKSALIDYNSEYHYIFSRLYSLKNKQTLDHFLAANLSRKLLEYFLSFKFPKSRTFKQLFDVAISASGNLKDERKENIRVFMNTYSHSTFGRDFSENIVGESTMIISDIFEWIRELDENHYKEMVEVVKD